MTRDKAINILARLAGGATQPSWDEIRKAAQFVCNVLFASPEDAVHIQFNDERTFKREQPQGLDEAAEFYYEQDCPYPGEARVVDNEHDIWFPSDAIEDAFKAGAKWMAGQGVSVEGKVIMDFSDPMDIINRRLVAKLGDVLLGIEQGDVIVQIRKA